MEVMRLHLMFDVEDPAKFGERLARAYVDRIYMDSKVRYEFYVSSMPESDSGDISTASINKIVTDSKNSRKLRENSFLPIEYEMADINKLYGRTMNKILFNKYLDEGGDKSSILPNKLILPDRNEKEEIDEIGMIEMEKATYTYEPKGEDYSYPSSKEYNEIFQEFCLESVFTKRCSCIAIQEIKSQ